MQQSRTLHFAVEWRARERWAQTPRNYSESAFIGTTMCSEISIWIMANFVAVRNESSSPPRFWTNSKSITIVCRVFQFTLFLRLWNIVVSLRRRRRRKPLAKIKKKKVKLKVYILQMRKLRASIRATQLFTVRRNFLVFFFAHVFHFALLHWKFEDKCVLFRLILD